MARHNHRHGIAPASRAHGARCFLRADLPGQFAIAERLAEGNLQQALPHHLLIRRAVQIQRQIEIGAAPGKVFADLADGFGDMRASLLGRRCGASGLFIARAAALGAHKIYLRDAFRRGDDVQHANWRFQAVPGFAIFHFALCHVCLLRAFSGLPAGRPKGRRYISVAVVRDIAWA